jgi:hypothetical protein
MVCTFSAGCPGEPDESPLPPRMSNDTESWVDDTHDLPSRIACKFAVYPLGSSNHMDTIYDLIREAKKSPAYKGDVKMHFCSMLDGDGDEVFNVLRSSVALARQRHFERDGGVHLTMTATLTTKKSAWKK